MKKLLSIITLLTVLVGSVFAAEREIKVSYKGNNQYMTYAKVSNYDADFLATQKFDTETMTNYFVTLYFADSKRWGGHTYVIVECRSVGKNAEYFWIITTKTNIVSWQSKFKKDFDKNWQEVRSLAIQPYDDKTVIAHMFHKER